jgi:hypothetical protein
VFLFRPIEFGQLNYAVGRGRVLIVAGSVWNSYNRLRSRGHSTDCMVRWDVKSEFPIGGVEASAQGWQSREGRRVANLLLPGYRMETFEASSIRE